MRNSILGNLGSTGDQSRIKCPRFFNQRRGRSQNVTAASTGLPVGVKVLVSFYRRGEDSAFESDRSRVTFDISKQSREAAVKTTVQDIKEALNQEGRAVEGIEEPVEKVTL